MGEGGVYLHGWPYFLAPDEQTHVPVVLWLSDGYLAHETVDRHCLGENSQSEHSHDEIFPTLLRVFEVESKLVKDSKTLFGACQSH